VNDQDITQKARKFAVELVGEEHVDSLELRLTSEDFAFFSQQYPSTFYRFGVKGESNTEAGGLHSSNFSIDEDALEVGTSTLAWLAWSFLND
jgi:hippurate hydrolase